MADSIKDFIVFAHRGASGTEPENTLRAFRKAIKLGAQWIELDVQNVQNCLLVFHDERLDRTTNGSGPVAEKTIHELRALSAGGDEKIPYLHEVLDLAGKKTNINIELKGQETAALTVSLMDQYVRQHQWTYDRFIVSSFIPSELRRVKSLQPQIRVGVLHSGICFHPLGRFIREINPYSVHLRKDRAHPTWIKNLKERGKAVFVFTVNEPREAQWLQSIGVDGIFTDFPERFILRKEEP